LLQDLEFEKKVNKFTLYLFMKQNLGGTKNILHEAKLRKKNILHEAKQSI